MLALLLLGFIVVVVVASVLACGDNGLLLLLLLLSFVLLYQKQRYTIAVIDTAVAATAGSRISGRVTIVVSPPAPAL